MKLQRLVSGDWEAVTRGKGLICFNTTILSNLI